LLFSSHLLSLCRGFVYVLQNMTGSGLFAGAGVFLLVALIAATSTWCARNQASARAARAAETAKSASTPRSPIPCCGDRHPLVRAIGIKKLIPILAVATGARPAASRNTQHDEAPAE